MSIWRYNVTRLDGELMAYVKVQDDWTGNIVAALRKVRMDDEGYYFRAENRRIHINKEVESYTRRESEIEYALKFFKENYR